LNYGSVESSLGLKAHRLQKMGLTQAGVSINEKRIIGFARRVTYRNTTGVSKPIAWANYKILKGIIRMKPKRWPSMSRTLLTCLCPNNFEFHRYKVPGYLLRSTHKSAAAIITQELDCRLIRTADPQRTAI
jgi:hypothetical protein